MIASNLRSSALRTHDTWGWGRGRALRSIEKEHKDNGDGVGWAEHALMFHGQRTDKDDGDRSRMGTGVGMGMHASVP